MNDNGAYAHEKFLLAVQDLAAGSSDLRTRLRNAWHDHLRQAWSPHHWPSPELAEKYQNLKDDVLFLGPNGDGLLQIMEEDARTFSHRIVSIFIKLTEHLVRSEHRGPLK